MRPVAMVGRGAELVELGDAWSRVVARAPAARTVVITGGAGLGKSLLVASALESASPPPATVLAGRARVHSPAPYDWLAGMLSGRDLTGLPVPADAPAWLGQHPDAPRERYAPGTLLRAAVPSRQGGRGRPAGVGPRAAARAPADGRPASRARADRP